MVRRFITALIIFVVCAGFLKAQGKKYTTRQVDAPFDFGTLLLEYDLDACVMDTILHLEEDLMNANSMCYGASSKLFYFVDQSWDRKILSYDLVSQKVDTVSLDYYSGSGSANQSKVDYIEEWSADSLLIAGVYWSVLHKETGEGRVLRDRDDGLEKVDPPAIFKAVRHYGNLLGWVSWLDELRLIYDDLEGSEVLIDELEFGENSLLGMTSMISKCGIRKLYIAIEELGMHSLDLETGAIRLVCDVNMSVYRGWADLDPRDTIPCSLTVDLDRNDNNGQGLDYAYVYCAHSGLPIADIDVLVYNENPTDSIVVELLGGTEEQYLEGMGSAAIQIENDGGQRLVLINNGDGQDTDFEEVIESLRLYDDGDHMQGVARIVFTSYYDGLEGDPAIATLTVSNRSLVADIASSVAVCEGSDLFTAVDLDDAWLLQDMQFNELATGPVTTEWDGLQVLVIDTSLYCRDTALVVVSVVGDPELALVDILLCPGEEYVYTLPDPYIATGWSTGENGPTILLSQEGPYSVTYTESQCQWQSDFEVFIAPDPVVDTVALTLQDGEARYQEMVYEDEGIYTLVTPSADGCDSLQTYVIISSPKQKIELPNIVSKTASVSENRFFGINCISDLAYRLEVYDRYGNKLFQGVKDCNNKLNVSATDWVSGVYVYTIQLLNVTDSESLDTQHVGTFTVIE